MTSSLYQEVILDHYRNPRNRGTLKNPTKHYTRYNPLCGDVVTIEVMVRNGVVKEIAFSASGCAISQASVSLLTEYVKNKTISDLINIDQSVILDLLGIEISPVRLKCALLPLETLQCCIK